MFQKIKNKIKLAKIWAIIFALIFLALIINSICLTYKVIQLEKQSYSQFDNNNNDVQKWWNH